VTLSNTDYQVLATSTGAIGALDVTMRSNNKTTSTVDIVGIVNSAITPAIFDIVIFGDWF